MCCRIHFLKEEFPVLCQKGEYLFSDGTSHLLFCKFKTSNGCVHVCVRERKRVTASSQNHLSDWLEAYFILNGFFLLIFLVILQLLVRSAPSHLSMYIKHLLI